LIHSLAVGVRRIGLGLLVGAIFHTTASAQVRDTSRTKRDTSRSPTDTITARRDTSAKRDTTRDVRIPLPPREDSLLQRDSLLRRDSARAVMSRDTIKAPLTTAEAPVLADPSGSFVWDRRDVFSTGALTVQDLLDRIPGVTGLRSGWIAQPMVSAFLGDPGRVRVFLDGLELEELDPRMRPIWDLTQIPLWALDDIRVERGASEIRIHLRSWRVERTTPYTRTDIYTGDQSTNLYRGLFGRRYQNGEILQLAGQQHGTSPGGLLESSDQLGVLARIGIARAKWTADAFLLRQDRNRGRAFAQGLIDSIPPTESTRSDVYVRFGWGKPERGWWAQALANASKYAYGGSQSTSTGNVDADTTRYRSQYLVTGGYARGAFRASFAQRYLTGLQKRIATPSARVGFDTRLLTISAFAEGRGVDSTRRLEVAGVVRPLSFVFVAGAAGVEQPISAPDSIPAPTFLRGEAGVRLRDFWLSGGVLRRDAVLLDAPRILVGSTETVVDPTAHGFFATIRGRIWKSLYADVQAIQWTDTAGFYRPRYQTRSELYLSTQLLERFPSRNFHMLLSAAHEYRSSVFWPDSTGAIRMTGYRSVATLLQFRIVTAEVFWNLRNVLDQRYTQVPGYRQPRLTNIYGVRWEFWN
jgi:hypothetical protein